MLTQSYLKECFSYNPQTGEFCWRKRPCNHFKTQRAFTVWNKKHPGKEAGTADTRGYRICRIDGQRFLVHRLIWLYMTGNWPDIIDHVDQKVTNNAWNNLRNTDKQGNSRNAKKPLNNTSGCVGVYFFKPQNVWAVRIKINYKDIHIGYFKHFDDAVAARKKAEIKYGFLPNHGR